MATKIAEEQWLLKKIFLQVIIQKNLFFFFTADRLRCHLVNTITERKLFRKQFQIESMGGSGKHFKKLNTCLFYHSSGGTSFPDLWSLACNSPASNSLVLASKAAQHLYLDENIFNSQLAFGKPFSSEGEDCSAWIPGTERGRREERNKHYKWCSARFQANGKRFYLEKTPLVSLLWERCWAGLGVVTCLGGGTSLPLVHPQNGMQKGKHHLHVRLQQLWKHRHTQYF